MQYYIARDCTTQGNAKTWVLQNILTGAYVNATDEDVKQKIRSKQVDIANLTLTKDNRLVKASEYKFEAFKEMMQAPQQLLGHLNTTDKSIADSIESSLDKEIHDSLGVYTKKYGKYVTINNTDSDKNLLAAQFKLGVDTYLMIKYQKVIYGIDNDGYVYFDCLIGVEAIRCGKVCEFIKAVPSKLSFYINRYSGAIVSDELKVCYGSFQLSPKVNGKFRLDDNNERLCWSGAIMKILGDQMDEIVLSNPALANNVDVNNCLKYDKTRKEYVKLVSSCVGASALGTIALSAIAAVAIATNPEIIQAGLLAKLTNIGTTQQILNAIKNVSIVGGGITGAAATSTIARKVGVFDKGKEMRNKMNASKVKKGKTFDSVDEQELRNERALIKERAMRLESDN